MLFENETLKPLKKFWSSSNLRKDAIFEIFKKKKCRFMCYNVLQDKVDDVINDTIALNDKKWQVCFGQFSPKLISVLFLSSKNWAVKQAARCAWQNCISLTLFIIPSELKSEDVLSTCT